MKYCSTRGGESGLSFENAVMMGLAEDGGLLVPEELPRVRDRLPAWKSMSFQELSLEIMQLFVGNCIPVDDLARLIERSYLVFRDEQVTPLKEINSTGILELFHGPTFAFKDVALQFLGNLFEFFLESRGHPLRILGATSGDTGSAAIHAMRGKQGVEVFMLHPKGRVSSIQERQMTTVLDQNVHNLAVEGSFDDAQRIVKSLFNDVEFKLKVYLGAVNSINWARIMAQIVYYFHAWAQIARDQSESVSFVVPTGNFGNVLACHYARRMGLPVANLVVATNQNDILHRFFSRGEYLVGQVEETWSPSMDIQVSSNFERYLYELSGQEPATMTNWMEEFSSTGRLTLSGEVKEHAGWDFLSARVNNAETLECIRTYHFEHQYLVDPHTAVGLAAAEKCGIEPPVICLACAHPAKFGGAVLEATGAEAELPPELAMLEKMETRCFTVAADPGRVRQVIEDTLRLS